MKSNMMKKTLAIALSATMVMGMSVTSFAADTTTGDAPIYSFDVTQVVVPTTFVTAFNPNELDVKVGSSTSAAQVLSQSYGILNKSSKDKIVTVDLTVTDKNDDPDTEDEKKVSFVETDAEVTSADKDTYAIHLTAVPADATEVQVGDTPASADKDTTAAALGKVTMAKATGKAVTLMAGGNQLGFKLEKAVYSPKNGNELTLGGAATSNDVSGNFEITGVAAAGKGITAFTFDGKLNDKADWTKLTKGIGLTATYTFANADGTETAVAGTGAMIEVEAAPTFTTGDVGVINIAVGKGEKAFASLESISAPWDGNPLDLTSYATLADDKSTITIADSMLGGWADKSENPTATINYKNVAGDSKKTTVQLKTH